AMHSIHSRESRIAFMIAFAASLASAASEPPRIMWSGCRRRRSQTRSISDREIANSRSRSEQSFAACEMRRAVRFVTSGMAATLGLTSILSEPDARGLDAGSRQPGCPVVGGAENTTDPSLWQPCRPPENLGGYDGLSGKAPESPLTTLGVVRS